MELLNQRYLITGSNSGIGLAAVKQLLSKGAIVYGFDVQESTLNHANFHALNVDVTKEEEVREAFLSIKNNEGLLNGIINCAGITGARQSIKKTSPQEFKRVVDVHLFGTYNVCHYGVSCLKEDKSSAIVNTSSLFAIKSTPNFIAYNAAKRAIISVTETMALELAPNIRVNAIAPGFIDTPMTQANPNYEKMVENTLHYYPLQRIGKPEEVAEIILMLLTHPFITGETIKISGGAHL